MGQARISNRDSGSLKHDDPAARTRPAARGALRRAALETLEGRMLLSAGDLDPNFGAGGKVTTNLFDDVAAGSGEIVRQSDGKIVGVGVMQDVGGSNFTVTRYNADGSADTGFGDGGGVVTNLGGTDIARGVALQADGKIVAAGLSDSSIALVRYNTDGSLDTGFGTGGIAKSDSLDGYAPHAEDVAVQADGRIVVAGYFGSPVGGSAQILLARFNADGSPDATFGNLAQPGIWWHAPFGFVGEFRALSIVIQPDGKFVTAGNGGGLRLTVARFEADGQVDSTFPGGPLLSYTPFTSSVLVAYNWRRSIGLALQSDGKIVIGGTTGGRTDFAVVRLLPDGAPDPSFSGDGLAVAHVATAGEEVTDLAVQSDGKIVAVGITGTLVNDFAAARFNSDGSLDTSFAGDGTASYPVVGSPASVISTPDHGIVMPGLTRLTSAGSPDPDFQQYTPILVDSSRTDIARKVVATQGDGKLLVVGESGDSLSVANPDVVVARYLTNGTLDPSFGDGGIVRFDLPSPTIGRAIAVQNDGRIVVAGQFGFDFLALRLNQDGSLDTSFGGIGFVSTSIGSSDAATSVVIQADGKILVGGQAQMLGTGFDYGLVRYNVDGSLDTTFDGDGIVSTAFGSGSGQDFISGLAIQDDGRIVAAGLATLPGTLADFSLARYNTDGSLDSTFGIGGMVTTAFAGPSSDVARAVALLANGKILVAGTAAFNNMALARYNSDGSLDDGSVSDTTPGDSFGIGGLVTTDFFGFLSVGNSLAMQANGKAVVAGAAGGDFALARYDVNGMLDASFGVGGRVLTDFASGIDTANGVAIQADGSIVAVGQTIRGGFTGNDFALARYIGDPVNSAPEITSITSSSFDADADQIATVGSDVTVTFSFTDADASDSHTYLIDWGDGTTTPLTPTSPGTINVSHAYSAGGIYAISLTVEDSHDASDSAHTQAMVTGTSLANDGTLYFIGSHGSDRVQVSSDGQLVTVTSHVSGQNVTQTFAAEDVVTLFVILGDESDQLHAAGITIPVYVLGGDGNDHIQTGSGADSIYAGGGDDRVQAGAGNNFVDGGAGNDQLQATAGHNILLGGPGDDFVQGGSGRDLLIGGDGSDRILGRDDDDILIAAFTDHDGDSDALKAIHAEWLTSALVTDRIANIRSGGGLNGSFLLNDATVHDDGLADVLTGSGGTDWFFFNADSDNEAERDRVTDASSAEQLSWVDIDFSLT